MKISDLKFQPCTECNTTPANWRTQRTVFILTDRVETRCNNCGARETFEKSIPVPQLVGCDAPFPELIELLDNADLEEPCR